MRPTPGARRSDSTVSSRSPWWATSYPRRSPRRSPRARNRRARLVEYRPHAREVTVEPRGKLPQPVPVALTRGALDLAAERADIVEAVAASRAHERIADLARDRKVARLDCSADFVRHLPAVARNFGTSSASLRSIFTGISSSLIALARPLQRCAAVIREMRRAASSGSSVSRSFSIVTGFLTTPSHPSRLARSISSPSVEERQDARAATHPTRYPPDFVLVRRSPR